MNLKIIPDVTDKKILLPNEAMLKKKIESFISSYKSNKNKLIGLFDFDYTISKCYNYQTKTKKSSSYRFYDVSLIGGDQSQVIQSQNDLCDKYIKYEEDSSFEFSLRDQMMKEFYTKSLDIYINEKFKRESVSQMLQNQKEKFELRGYVKEYLESFLSMEIPIIIISGGIKQVIEDLLVQIIPNFEKFCEQKKIYIIANDLIFDKEKGCIGYSNDIVYTFNKASFVKRIIDKYYPNIENAFVLGDHINDYDSVRDLGLSGLNVISYGFVNIKPENIDNEEKKEENQKKIDSFKNIYDVILIGDADFSFPNQIMKVIQEKSNKI